MGITEIPEVDLVDVVSIIQDIADTYSITYLQSHSKFTHHPNPHLLSDPPFFTYRNTPNISLPEGFYWTHHGEITSEGKEVIFSFMKIHPNHNQNAKLHGEHIRFFEEFYEYLHHHAANRFKKLGFKSKVYLGNRDWDYDYIFLGLIIG